MDSTSKFGNFLDKSRYHRCLAYLNHLDKSTDMNRYPMGYSHSVHMNSYLTLTVSRKTPHEITILLRRVPDSCILFIDSVIKLNEETISRLTEKMIHKVIRIDTVKKCLSCTDAAKDGTYCRLCSLSQSTYSENPCPICLDDSHVTAIWKKLPCHHLFHDECMKKVVKDDQITCPLCRQICNRKDALIY